MRKLSFEAASEIRAQACFFSEEAPAMTTRLGLVGLRLHKVETSSICWRVGARERSCEKGQQKKFTKK